MRSGSFLLASVLCLAVGIAALAPAPVVAQETAESLYRKLVAPSGYGHRMRYRGFSEDVIDPATGQSWSGLQVDVAFGYAPGTRYGGVVAVFRNLSGQAYCIRPAYAFEPGQQWSSVQANEPGNYLIEPGQEHLLVMAQALGEPRSSLVAGVAFWRPDRSRQRVCSDVAPAGVAEWSARFRWDNAYHFTGSRR